MLINNLTKKSFKKYGIIGEHHQLQTGYEPLIKEKSEGWIWALLTFDNRTMGSLECHPNSFESFEPLSGTAILLVAPFKKPAELKAFLLDKPVILNKGVWHSILTLSQKTQVKIMENLHVATKKIKLPCELKINLG